MTRPAVRRRIGFGLQLTVLVGARVAGAILPAALAPSAEPTHSREPGPGPAETNGVSRSHHIGAIIAAVSS